MTVGAKSKGFNSSEIKEVDFFVMRRLQELTGGDHRSVFNGTGFDFVGLRDWQPGDKLSSVDWPQSIINNFDPLVVKEFEEDKNGKILIVADASLSMCCGIDGFGLKDIAARAIAAIGFSGVFFQDLTGLFIFDHKHRYAYIKPRMGKNHVIGCVNRYINSELSYLANNSTSLGKKILSYLNRTSVVPVVSDFLFENASDFIDNLAIIKSRHDLFIVIIDSSFLFDLPEVSSGWIECLDAEDGKTIVLSRAEFMKMSERVVAYQNSIIQKAQKVGIEILKVGQDKNKFYNDLTEFFFNRRTRRKISVQ